MEAKTVPGVFAPPFTFEEWLELPETSLPCELVEGRLIMTPPPGVPHQRASPTSHERDLVTKWD